MSSILLSKNEARLRPALIDDWTLYIGTTYLYLEHTKHIFIQKVWFVFVYIL